MPFMFKIYDPYIASSGEGTLILSHTCSPTPNLVCFCSPPPPPKLVVSAVSSSIKINPLII